MFFSTGENCNQILQIHSASEIRARDLGARLPNLLSVPYKVAWKVEAQSVLLLPKQADKMNLKIFLDEKGFYCLNEAIPAKSRSKRLLEEGVRVKFFGSNFVISCDEVEAGNLLFYAGHCPSVVASIHKALRSAGGCPALILRRQWKGRKTCGRVARIAEFFVPCNAFPLSELDRFS